MLTVKTGKKNEVDVRVFLESDLYGREFFDGYESLGECAEAVARLVGSSLKQTQQDGIARQVGIAIVPRAEYGSTDGYGDGIDGE
jgi:hypothetical protein